MHREERPVYLSNDADVPHEMRTYLIACPRYCFCCHAWILRGRSFVIGLGVLFVPQRDHWIDP
jgi:hypothetical protein